MIDLVEALKAKAQHHRLHRTVVVEAHVCGFRYRFEEKVGFVRYSPKGTGTAVLSRVEIEEAFSPWQLALATQSMRKALAAL